jgi:mono/diheme cytochrome c family protein
MSKLQHLRGLQAGVVLAVLATLVGLVSCQDQSTESPSAERPGSVGQWEPTTQLASSPKLLSLGQSTYEKHCSACHGLDGRGTGDAAYLLYPKPRDFVGATYRLVSTWEGIPTDDDLYRTISRGMPGSAMPSWAHLPERTRWGLVHYVKSLAEHPITIAPTSEGDAASGVIQLTSEPTFDHDARRIATELFAKGCAPCHGVSGRGDGTQEQFDDKGFPIRPRDLTTGVFKGIPTAEHIYRRIVGGLPGSPMPQSGYLQGDDAWHLAHFVLSLSSEAQRRRVEMLRFRIPVVRLAVIPTHPDDGLWTNVPRTNLHMMPLWWRSQRPEELTVQAAHDGHDIAFLLTWFDETHDHTALRPQDFRDAAAIEFSLSDDPPFFAMGNRGEFVNIWMWKAERQADLEPVFQDIDNQYPNIGIDAYPNLSRSALEQPTRNALTLHSDSTFVTGWGAGNIVSDPTRRSPVEDLTAQGFGSLVARPRVDQLVFADGEHTTGTYRVIFRRSLNGQGAHAIDFDPGSMITAAFAVWNGSAGDRDGKKSVTIWQELALEP